MPNVGIGCRSFIRLLLFVIDTHTSIYKYVIFARRKHDNMCTDILLPENDHMVCLLLWCGKGPIDFTHITLGNPLVHPGKNTTPTIWYTRENGNFDWLNRYLYTGEHFQSNLEIFRCDSMFVKPHDVPPVFCFNVPTDIRFLLQQLLVLNFLQRIPSGDRDCCNKISCQLAR